MKRLMMTVGCCVCTCALHAREILWTGPSGGNWTEVSNWVDAETQQPIKERWDDDIAVFDPDGGELEVVNDFDSAAWPYALRVGGFRVLSGTVTISGEKRINLRENAAKIEVATGATLNLDNYTRALDAVWNIPDCSIAKTGGGTLVVTGTLGLRENGQTDTIPFFIVEEGAVVFNQRAKIVIDDFRVKSGATVQFLKFDPFRTDVYTKLTLEEGSLLKLDCGGAVDLNGISGGGTITSGTTTYLNFYLTREDCLFSGTVSGKAILHLPGQWTAAAHRLTIANERMLQDAGGFVGQLYDAVSFSPGVREFALPKMSAEKTPWLTYAMMLLPKTNAVGQSVRLVGSEIVQAVDEAVVEDGRALIGQPTTDLNGNETMFKRARSAGVMLRTSDADAAVTVDGGSVRLGAGRYSQPQIDALAVRNGGVAEFVTTLKGAGHKAQTLTLDGGTLRLRYPWTPSTCDFFATGDWTVLIGANGGRVEGVIEGVFSEQSGWDAWAAALQPMAGVAEPGPVTFAVARNLKLANPLSLSTPVRVEDGHLVVLESCHANGVTDVLGTGALCLGNAGLTQDATATPVTTTLATGDGAALAYDGGARLGISANPLTIGAANAAEPKLARQPGGALFFYESTVGKRVDGSRGKVMVNGPLSKDATGRLQPAVFTQTKFYDVIGQDGNKTGNSSLDFAGYDAEKGVVTLTGLPTSLEDDVADKSVCLDLNAAHSVAAGMTKQVGAVQLVGGSGSLAVDGTLSVGAGADPACVILNSRVWQGASITGSGTVDFGGREGVVVANATGYAGTGPRIAAKIAGTGGVSFVAPFATPTVWIELAGANTYEGGTWINGLQVRPKTTSAFGAGTVRTGFGYASGGQVLFTVAGLDFANGFVISGNGPVWSAATMNSGALWFAARTKISGPVEIVRRARISMNTAGSVIVPAADSTAEFAGVVSGDALQLMNCKSPVVFTASNTYTGGTEVVSSTLVLKGAGTAGTGPVVLDDGVLRFENGEPVAFGNDLEGLGRVTLAGSAPVTFAANTVRNEDLVLELATKTTVFAELPPFDVITNATPSVASVAIAGDLGTVAWGDRQLVPANRVDLTIGEGTVLDLGGRTLTVRRLGDGDRARIVNGEVVEIKPRMGFMLWIR